MNEDSPTGIPSFHMDAAVHTLHRTRLMGRTFLRCVFVICVFLRVCVFLGCVYKCEPRVRDRVSSTISFSKTKSLGLSLSWNAGWEGGR